jgi:hypothetical protein
MKNIVIHVRVPLFMMSISVLFASLALADPGTTLSATVTCSPHYTRTYNWTIDKSVTPESWDLFRGDAGTSQFTITVTKDQGTDAAWMDGEICVTNGGAVPTQNLTIRVVLKDGAEPPNDSIAGYGVDVSGKPVLGPGETSCYDYHADIPSNLIHPGHTYKITAIVTITNHSGWEPGGPHCPGPDPCPFGPSPSCTSNLPASPILINDTIHVDDTNGGSWTFNLSGSVAYTETFTCDGDAGSHSNTAAIRETSQSDGALVMVNCYALEIRKDAHTSFTRTYYWTIDKFADQSALTLSIGQIFTGVNYSVIVDATYTDSDWAVNGTITMYNPAPIPAVINNISDIVSGVGAATIDCSVSFPYTLAPGGMMTCTYNANLPDASSRTNTATATLQNYSYDYLMNSTPDGTTDFNGSAAVDFSEATINHVDECLDVNDTYAGVIGTVCYGDGVPKTFTYTRDIGPYNECGDYTVGNSAQFETNDTHTMGSDSWTINVHVPCAGGCTLTQGYWKTHSEFGPAPYDDTWAMLPNGANPVFFLSSKTWYQVFWTSPSGGNAYYILAHQYMAAKLNFLNGASSTPAVDAAIAWAETQFFNIYTPSSNLSKSVRQQAVYYADLLDQYNKGLIGPGHCSENGFGSPKSNPFDNENIWGETGSLMPDAYTLDQNYPNPFNPITTISFTLPVATDYELIIYNMMGQRIAIFTGHSELGTVRVDWDASNYASGVYLYKLTAGSFSDTKKMVLMK